MSFTSFSEEVKVWLRRNNWVLWKKLREKSWTDPCEEFKLRVIKFGISYPKSQEKNILSLSTILCFSHLSLSLLVGVHVDCNIIQMKYYSDGLQYYSVLYCYRTTSGEILFVRLSCWLRLNFQGDWYARSYDFTNPFGWCFIYEKRTRPLKETN